MLTVVVVVIVVDDDDTVIDGFDVDFSPRILSMEKFNCFAFDDFVDDLSDTK